MAKISPNLMKTTYNCHKTVFAKDGQDKISHFTCSYSVSLPLLPSSGNIRTASA